MFQIEKVVKSEGAFLVTIAEYPLLARAVCSRISKGKLQLEADLVFARYMGSGRYGTPYVGAWMTAENEVPRQLAAATENGLLTAVEKIPSPETYVNKLISIWQIGAGDFVEISAVEEN